MRRVEPWKVFAAWLAWNLVTTLALSDPATPGAAALIAQANWLAVLAWALLRPGRRFA